MVCKWHMGGGGVGEWYQKPSIIRLQIKTTMTTNKDYNDYK